jgi:hypothetical protein
MTPDAVGADLHHRLRPELGRLFEPHAEPAAQDEDRDIG